MYTGSHLKLILVILLIPSIFIFLIIADSENRNFTNDPELTVEKISLDPIISDINIPKESKIKITSGDTFYSTMIDFGVSPRTISKIAQDRKLKKFISLRVNDVLYITLTANGLIVKRFDENFFLDVLTIKNGDFIFEKKRDNLERIVQFREFVISDSLYSSGKKANVPDSVLGDLIYIFGWDIDYASEMVIKLRFFMKTYFLMENLFQMGIF